MSDSRADMWRMGDFWRTAKKTVTAVVTGTIGWAAVVVASDAQPITSSEWLMLATVLATSVGVYGVSNQPVNG